MTDIGSKPVNPYRYTNYSIVDASDKGIMWIIITRHLRL